VSRVDPTVDLGGLARPEDVVRPPKRRLLRVVVPLALLLGFGAVVLSTLDGVFGEAIDATIVRPTIVSDRDAAAFDATTPLLQAAGWVEPEPYPILVTALTDGVVADVRALEGDAVEENAVLARLVADDRALATTRATAALKKAEAATRGADATASIAGEAFDAALDVDEALGVATGKAAGDDAAHALRLSGVAEGEARVKTAEAEVALQKALADSGAAPPWAVPLAEAELASAKAALAGLKAEAAAAEAAAQIARVVETKARRDRDLRFVDREKRDVARAAADAAREDAAIAAADAAIVALDAARLDVRAPKAGVVLERLVAPGSPVGPDGPPLFTLYDPKSIRVRVDVPQTEVRKLLAARRAEIRSEARGDRPYRGEVVRVVHKADIQKVTLQAHVRIDDPDEALRPEMLCQVRLFADAAAKPDAGAGRESAATRLRIPARLVKDGAVFVLDADGSRARSVKIEVGGRVGDDVDVLRGIDLTAKLLDSGATPLEDGARVRVEGGGR
jgi:HlyD family secretion protein